LTVDDADLTLQSVDSTINAHTRRCLAAIAASGGEGSRTFTQVYAQSALTEADAADQRHQRGTALSRVDGSAVAVKDLFDVAGQTTWAGSMVLRDAPAAVADAPAVASLRRGGSVIVGKTNMTEFAYSGLGLNPHFGTPANPYRRAVQRRIPGGSSSGAAIAVTDGMADIGLGTDTGGSVRIPAALCGLVGWKPSARRISLAGVWPLAPTFDSVGVIARSVNVCIDTDAVLAEAMSMAAPPPLNRLRLARVRGYIETELDSEVADAYESAILRLARAGVQIVDLNIPSLERVPRELPGVTMPTYEAFRTHEKLLAQCAEAYDPRVRYRLELGRRISAEEYAAAASVRKELQRAATDALQDFDAWLLPTVAIVAPPFAVFDSDERYLAINRKVLRNASLINFLDGCAITLPCHEGDSPPVGLSIAGLQVRDARVLAIAKSLEPIVRMAAPGE
jgi:aspartyl-tRNA(Asn)/glutamyl-tRNA(Gln) amidotransferase subunit A